MTETHARIPAFIGTDPELWFKIVEANFTRLNITDEKQKYFEVLAVLPPHFAKEIRDIAMSTVDDQSFSRLKMELVKRLCASQEEKTRQLLEKETMGDEKPSQFLRRLKILAGDVIPESVLRSLWASRLPTSLQPIIATQMDKSLDTTAELADVVSSTTSNRSAMLPTNDNLLATTLQQLTLKLDGLTEHLSSIKKEVAEMRYQRDENRSRPRNRSSSSRQRSSSRGARPKNICWYHWKFQDAATKCTKPCSLVLGNASGSL